MRERELLTRSEEAAEDLDRELADARQRYLELARELSRRRRVAAKSFAPRVESATICIEEITTAGAASRSASRPSSAGIPGPTKIASSV